MLRFEQRPRHYGNMSAPMSVTETPLSKAAIRNDKPETEPSLPDPPQHRHLWIITGPAGCGKSTVAEFLAAHFGYPYIEGDSFHPESNIAKMASGMPLTDEDRWDWLKILRAESTRQLRKNTAGVVLTCSALKVRYRDELRKASFNEDSVQVHFIYLRAAEELLLRRVKARQGHYMKDSMVKSQFTALEEPTRDEEDVFIVDVSGTMPEVQSLAIDAVTKVLQEDGIEISAHDDQHLNHDTVKSSSLLRPDDSADAISATNSCVRSITSDFSAVRSRGPSSTPASSVRGDDSPDKTEWSGRV